MASVIALGERTLWGKYKRILSAGEMHIEEGNVSKVYGAGEVEIKDSIVGKVRVAGEMNVTKSHLLDVNVVGEINLNGVIKSDYMVVRGELNAECLECGHLVVGGKSDRINSSTQIDTRITGFLKTKIFENYGEINLDFEHEIDQLINGGVLIGNGEIVCDRLYSFGEIKGEEVNAEFIYIKPIVSSKIGNVVGTQIKMTKHYEWDKTLKNISRKYFKKYYEKVNSQDAGIMEVNSIEGDQIEIEYIKAERVSGIDVRIGELCIIDRVEYTGNIHISPKAVVNEVIKL